MVTNFKVWCIVDSGLTACFDSPEIDCLEIAAGNVNVVN